VDYSDLIPVRDKRLAGADSKNFSIEAQKTVSAASNNKNLVGND
jgi:hypothetical protein